MTSHRTFESNCENGVWNKETSWISIKGRDLKPIVKNCNGTWFGWTDNSPECYRRLHNSFSLGKLFTIIPNKS